MEPATSPTSTTQVPQVLAPPRAAAESLAIRGEDAHPIPALSELYGVAEARAVALTEPEFAQALLAAAERCHYNHPADTVPTVTQREAFFRGLHLTDFALAQACALGREPAWQLFLARFRAPLLAAATAITGSSTAGHDLAESLPAELFGLSTRATDSQAEIRRSPLASYSGRGSLLGWLRSTLAQRHIDRHRRTHREAPLDNIDTPAVQQVSAPNAQTLTRLQSALTAVLRSLEPEDAFVLSSWFLDGHTLLQIARLLRVSEATVSRKVKRLTAALRTQLTEHLQSGGLSRRAAEEALGTDPRDLTLNLRTLLQKSAASAFPVQADPEQGNSPQPIPLAQQTSK